MPLSRRALAALALVFALPALAEDWPDTDWPRAQQPAGPALEAFERYAFGRRDDVRRKGIRTDAVVVIRDGRLLYERYAGPSRAETPHLTWSVSKSLLATLLGVAEGEGRFQLDDPVARYYPPFARHPEVTLRHLLNWSSGLDWQEDYEFAPLKSSVVAMLYTRGRDDMAGFVAETPPARPPGRRFRYSSGDSNVLAAALHGMLGADYAEYPWRALFEPLGIRSAVWERDAAGTFVGSSYVYMSARDLARVGLLMQRHGRWRERQLLPLAWVEFNLTPFARYRPSAEEEGEAVPGGQWWLNRAVKGARAPWPDVAETAFAALGHWGQALYVLPEEKLVIVRYADDRDGRFRHNEFLRLAQAAFAGEARP
ncbi:beta-lactamase family protein [Pseudomonas aeruginosa]|nr:beta-lactamase family protein [Pseudomonas aeruginosa]